MIKKPTGRSAMRLTTGVLVAATAAFTVGIGVADSASAATTGTITATPAASNSAKGGPSAPITVTDTNPAPGALEWAIVSGPDLATGPTLTNPANIAAGSFTVLNGGTAGTDVIRVFDGGTAGAAFAAGDAAAPDFNLIFSGPVTAVTQTPLSAQVTVNVAQTYTITGHDVGSRLAAGQPVAVDASIVLPKGTGILSCFGLSNPLTTTAGNHSVIDCNAGDATYTAHRTQTVTTDSNGKATFTVASSTAGTVTVNVGTAPAIAAPATLIVHGGKIGNNAVAAISVNPSTVSDYIGGHTHYVVTAVDSDGSPVGGATISYVVTSGPDAPPALTYGTLPGTTDNTTGQDAVDVTNLGTAGTDHITFFVNQTLAPPTTAGPDASEPQANATATYKAIPTYTTTGITTDPVPTLAGEIPSGSTVKVTETVTNGLDPVTHDPIPVVGAVITFTANGSSEDATKAVTATTDASGKATATIPVDSSANGKTLGVEASFGTASNLDFSGTLTFADRRPTSLQLTPSAADLQVAKGGTVSFTAKVVDQFGTGVSGQALTYSVTGRNNGKTGSATTGTGGSATISYPDTAVLPADNQDSVLVTDTTTVAVGSATENVDYLTSVTPDSVVIAPKPPVGASVTVATGPATFYTVTVKNAAGDLLTNVPVTVSANIGSVYTGPLDPGAATATVNTDASGTAFVWAGSTKSGVQTVTAKAGTKSDSAQLTYTADIPTTLTLTPAGAKITAGQSQKFTAKIVDEFGNPFPGVPMIFSQSGVGSISGGAIQVTDASGTASIVVSTPAGSTGSGSVSVDNTFVVIGPGGPGTLTNAVSYSVVAPVAPVVPKTISVSAGHATAGGHGLATAKVVNSNGTPASHVVVVFTVTGKNSVSGSATTNSSGVATWSYRALNAGRETVRATAQGGSKPSAATTITVAKRAGFAGLASTDYTITSGSAVMVYGKIKPSTSGLTVRLQEYSNGAWHLIGTTTTGHLTLPNVGKVYGYKIKNVAFNSKGSFKLRAVLIATLNTTTGVSRTITETVR